MNKTQLRKASRARRHHDGFEGYRDRCRDLIASLRRMKDVTPEDFRAALKRQRQSFSAFVAGRRVEA